MTHRLNAAINFHQDTSNSYLLMVHRRSVTNIITGKNQKLRKRQQSFLYVTHRLKIKHIVSSGYSIWLHSYYVQKDSMEKKSNQRELKKN